MNTFEWIACVWLPVGLITLGLFLRLCSHAPHLNFDEEEHDHAD